MQVNTFTKHYLSIVHVHVSCFCTTRTHTHTHTCTHKACWFGQSSAQCMCNDTACVNQAANDNPNSQMCCEWVPQPSDTDPESLNDPRATPLGFALLEYRGTDSNLPDLCVQVNFPQPRRNIRYVVAAVSPRIIC